MNKRKITVSKKAVLIPIIIVIIPVSFILLKKVIFNSKNSDPMPQNEVSVEKNEEVVKLPGNFPKDFPVFPESRLVASNSVKDKLEGISAIWEVGEDIENVSYYYLENLPLENWAYDVTVKENNFISMTVSKENIQGFMAITKGKEAKVIITVALGVK